MTDSWSVTLADVNPGFDEVPEGRYTFALMGASANKFDPESLDVKASITSEGESQGRVVFIRYPNPAKVGNFPIKALKRLEQAIGVDILPAEDSDGLDGKIQFLNRAAKDGVRFSGDMKKREYTNKTTGELVQVVDFQLFSVGPGA